MKILFNDESPIGTMQLRLNDKDELEARVTVQIPTLSGTLLMDGILNAEEICANIKNSFIHLAQHGSLTRNLPDENEEKN
jgi:hypothetical protein